jgi:hypothetical protein
MLLILSPRTFIPDGERLMTIADYIAQTIETEEPNADL